MNEKYCTCEEPNVDIFITGEQGCIDGVYWDTLKQEIVCLNCGKIPQEYYQEEQPQPILVGDIPF